MSGSESRYERSGKIRPCCLDKPDLLKLAAIIQESFTRPEVERYFKVSTIIENNRVFFDSLAECLSQEKLPDKINELSFAIEGWDRETRIDRNILLDFGKFAIQLNVAGKDPVWVYDRFSAITKFLRGKTAWYWPLITLERFLIFITTVIISCNVILHSVIKKRIFYIDEAILIGLWIFLVFYDTRKIWPYLNIDVKKGKTIFNKENIAAVLLIMVLLASFLTGTVWPWSK